MGLTNKDYHFFKMARKVAETSECDHFKVGCVFVYKNTVLSKASNSYKSHPLQKRYNRRYRKFNFSNNYILDSLHAEIAALTAVDATFDDWSKVKVYVYRICPGHEEGKGMSRPCPACLNALRDRGVRNIYYTTVDSYVYERLD